jgi:hypothetical protein
MPMWRPFLVSAHSKSRQALLAGGTRGAHAAIPVHVAPSVVSSSIAGCAQHGALKEYPAPALAGLAIGHSPQIGAELDADTAEDLRAIRQGTLPISWTRSAISDLQTLLRPRTYQNDFIR